jgi:hypothetical protein
MPLMRTFFVTIVVLFACTALAHAQLPVATGRQFTLSNPAWKVFIPNTYEQRPGNVADVLVHFHGDPQTFYNNAQYANLNSILVTVNYSGLSSAYSTPFSNSALFQTVLNEALTKVRTQGDIADSLAWDQIGVSSFSAGYGAVREILKSSTYRNQIDALLAADSIHAATAVDQTPLDAHMVDFKTFAGLAKDGTKTFLLSHSQVPTSGYESTTETANELLQHLGLSAVSQNVTGLGTLQFYRSAQAGNFRLWGTTGSDAPAHSKHLQYIGEFLKELPLALVPTSPADFDRDGRFDADDLSLWQASYGVNNGADADGDGDTDGRDFLLWQRRVRYANPRAAIAIPEPSTTILVIAVLALTAPSRRATSLRETLRKQSFNPGT